MRARLVWVVLVAVVIAAAAGATTAGGAAPAPVEIVGSLNPSVPASGAAGCPKPTADRGVSIIPLAGDVHVSAGGSREDLSLVSACLVSRVNAFGVSVPLSVRGRDGAGASFRLVVLPRDRWLFLLRGGRVFRRVAAHGTGAVAVSGSALRFDLTGFARLLGCAPRC